MSRNAAAKRFGVSITSAVRWVARFKTKGEISPAATGGDRRSGRIEAHRNYLLRLVRRRPHMTLVETQERLIGNCGERFSSGWYSFQGRPAHMHHPKEPINATASYGVLTVTSSDSGSAIAAPNGDQRGQYPAEQLCMGTGWRAMDRE